MPKRTRKPKTTANTPVLERLEDRLLLTTLNGNECFVYYNSQGEAVRVELQGSDDDRVELFGHLRGKATVTSMYVIRAVVGGRFTTPPVRAEAMYEPRIYSQHGGEDVVIFDPWDALTD